MDQILATQDQLLREQAPGAARRILGTSWRFTRRKPLGALGAALILMMVFCALFADRQVITLKQSTAPLVAPYYFDDQDLHNRLQGPSLAHPLGTDNLGRDQLSRIIYGARISLIIGLSAVLAAMVLATTVGVVSGYMGGIVDMVAQRIVDGWIALPPIVVLISGVQVAKAYFGDSPEAQTLAVIAVLGVVLAAGASRVIRSSAIAIKHNLYVEGARAIGATETHIVLRYILPNVIAVVIVLATLQLGIAILAEATISFLGFGVPPPLPSWGRALGPDSLGLIRRDAWLAFWPGFAIFLVVFGFNVFGDALRDVLDPRLRGGR
jgi:peptide/nickel transport system permease protein